MKITFVCLLVLGLVLLAMGQPEYERRRTHEDHHIGSPAEEHHHGHSRGARGDSEEREYRQKQHGDTWWHKEREGRREARQVREGQREARQFRENHQEKQDQKTDAEDSPMRLRFSKACL